MKPSKVIESKVNEGDFAINIMPYIDNDMLKKFYVHSLHERARINRNQKILITSIINEPELNKNN